MIEFNVSYSEFNHKPLISIKGGIGEFFDSSKIEFELSDEVYIDLSGINFINSKGIRFWLGWLEQLRSIKVVYFVKCPVIFVNQMSMIVGFLPDNGKVISFYVPFYSPQTEEDKAVLYRFGKEFGDFGLKHPEDVFDSQNNRMEIDVVETRYFKFLNFK